MPEAEKVFRLKASLQRAWAFLTDLKSLSYCIPGCKSVDVIDERNSVWRVEVVMGVLSKVVEMQARLEEVFPPSHIGFTFSSKAWSFEGRVTLDLKTISETETEVSCKLSLKSSGFLASTINYTFSRQVEEQAAHFAECVQAKITG